MIQCAVVFTALQLANEVNDEAVHVGIVKHRVGITYPV